MPVFRGILEWNTGEVKVFFKRIYFFKELDQSLAPKIPSHKEKNLINFRRPAGLIRFLFAPTFRAFILEKWRGLAVTRVDWFVSAEAAINTSSIPMDGPV